MIRTTLAIDPETFAEAVCQAEREGATLSAWTRALLALALRDPRLARRAALGAARERRRRRAVRSRR